MFQCRGCGFTGVGVQSLIEKLRSHMPGSKYIYIYVYIYIYIYIKQRHYCNIVNKDFLKNGPRQKIFEKIFGKLQDSTWS